MGCPPIFSLNATTATARPEPEGVPFHSTAQGTIEADPNRAFRMGGDTEW
jgi:hypothetical protein